MPTHTRPFFVEPLEIRIAPANLYFLTGVESMTGVTVEDADGMSVNDGTSATAVEASLAVLLGKGDSLVLDTNGNNELDAGEVVYAKVTSGSAMFFITDVNANGAVNPAEITGVAVGNKFKGIINGDVNGSVATLLTSAGALDTTGIQDASISGLVVTGRITGHVIAGQDISNVKIGTPGVGGELSVESIRTGTAASGVTLDLNGTATNSTSITPSYSFTSAGQKGGSISNVELAFGATEIRASDGNANNSGVGGAGGAINNLAMTAPNAGTFECVIAAGAGGVGDRGGSGGGVSRVALTWDATSVNGSVSIESGNGGNAVVDAQAGHGGNAGSISKITSKSLTETSAGNVTISAGNGGNAGLNSNGHGGNGGAVSSLVFDATFGFGRVRAYAGAGGEGVGNGNGGNGGAFTGAKWDLGATTLQSEVDSGEGGRGGANGSGGNAGAINKVTVTFAGASNGVDLYGGRGGDGQGEGSGGHGGSVTNATLTAVELQGHLNIGAGNGGNAGGGETGNGGNGGAVRSYKFAAQSLDDPRWIWAYGGNGGQGASGGVGGKGGDVVNGSAVAEESSGAGVFIYGGYGGNGGQGGNGGKIANFVSTFAGNNDTYADAFYSGGGGNGTNGDGGDGGAVSNMKLTVTGEAKRGVVVYAARGGDSQGGDGDGGKAGSLKSVSITKTAGTGEEHSIFTEVGGNGNGTGNGGAGGSLTNVSFNASVAVEGLNIGTKQAGNAGAGGLVGGNAGTVSKVKVTTTGAAPDGIEIYAGSGGNTSADGGRGGNAGQIKTVALDAFESTVSINSRSNSGAHGGDSSGLDSIGGKGGTVSGITGKVGKLLVEATRGGNAVKTGGDGGTVSNLKLSQVTDFVQLIRAGDGGDVGAGGVGGKGGTVTNFVTPGDIGDFTADFDLSPAGSGMGGLLAGQAGAVDGVVDPARNGSIINITATRIAAILAGSPASNALTASNAVAVITGLKKVTKVGADVDAEGDFDFSDTGSNGFNLDEGDTPVDGLVIVRAGEYRSNVTPLKLIEVS